ncbi:MAG: hypothetical protein AAF699_06715 [Pseudomonadota bacterium]
MISAKHCSIALGVILSGLATTSLATPVAAEYFEGRWVINSDCKNADAEYVHVRDNGTFEYGRRGKAEAVGFWASGDSVLAMEMLAAPASFADIEADLANNTTRGVYTMQVMPIDHEKDSFKGVVSFGDDMGMNSWTRCK